MGAGASVPDELTFDEAKALAGEKWDEKMTTFWPEGAEKIGKEQLFDIIQNIPMFAKRPDTETQLNVRDRCAVLPTWHRAFLNLLGPLNSRATDLFLPSGTRPRSSPPRLRSSISCRKKRQQRRRHSGKK